MGARPRCQPAVCGQRRLAGFGRQDCRRERRIHSCADLCNLPQGLVRHRAELEKRWQHEVDDKRLSVSAVFESLGDRNDDINGIFDEARSQVLPKQSTIPFATVWCRQEMPQPHRTMPNLAGSRHPIGMSDLCRGTHASCHMLIRLVQTDFAATRNRLDPTWWQGGNTPAAGRTTVARIASARGGTAPCLSHRRAPAVTPTVKTFCHWHPNDHPALMGQSCNDVARHIAV